MPDPYVTSSMRSRSPHRRSRSRDRSRERGRRKGGTGRDSERYEELGLRQQSDMRDGDKGGRRDRSYSKSRSRSRSISPRRHRLEDRGKRKRYRSRSRSPSNSPSSSSGASDERRRRRKKKKEKHRRHSGSRERKEKKRDKKDKKKKKVSGSVTSQWGKYGIIGESDLYTKEEEFRAWLVEECMINPETMSKDQTKKQFSKFVEDYNTATLPHEKFYNMKQYDARMTLLRNGEFAPKGDEDTYDPNADFRAHSSALKRPTSEKETYLSKEQLKELQRVQRERVEISKRKQLGLEVKQNLGVRMDGNEFED